MSIDLYYVKARLGPTILTCIPLLVFVENVISPLFKESLAQIAGILPFITDLGLYTSIIFLSVQVNRFIAKELFQRWYFREDIRMPTTDFLLWANPHLAPETKIILRQKVKHLFDLTLPDQQAEQADQHRARLLIVHAVSQIKNKLKDNKALYRHNIEYGFARNLIGGCVLALLFSIIIIVFAAVHSNYTLLATGVILLIIYSLPIISSRLIIARYGKYYAKVLYEQFLSI